MDVTPRKRTKIITLHQYGNNMTQRKIAEVVGVSLGVVNKLIRQHRETGNVNVRRKGKCGRRRKTTDHDDRYLLRESMRDPRKNSEDLMRDLVNCGTCKISSSTVRRRLIEKGRMARRPIKKQLLTKAMKAKRLDWAKRHKD